MKEILQNCYGHFETIKIEENISILEYLKELEKYRFILKQVNHEQFLELQNANKFMEIVCNPVAAFSTAKGVNFRSSSGLKISDPTEKVNGSFIIEEERIIFDAFQPFFEERDAGRYSGLSYYTEMSMLDILKEELNKERKLLIYMGQELNGVHFNDLFEEVSKEEFLEYAINPEKGVQALARRKHY